MKLQFGNRLRTCTLTQGRPSPSLSCPWAPGSVACPGSWIPAEPKCPRAQEGQRKRLDSYGRQPEKTCSSGPSATPRNATDRHGKSCCPLGCATEQDGGHCTKQRAEPVCSSSRALDTCVLGDGDGNWEGSRRRSGRTAQSSPNTLVPFHCSPSHREQSPMARGGCSSLCSSGRPTASKVDTPTNCTPRRPCGHLTRLRPTPLCAREVRCLYLPDASG